MNFVRTTQNNTTKRLCVKLRAILYAIDYVWLRYVMIFQTYLIHTYIHIFFYHPLYYNEWFCSSMVEVEPYF